MLAGVVEIGSRKSEEELWETEMKLSETQRDEPDAREMRVEVDYYGND